MLISEKMDYQKKVKNNEIRMEIIEKITNIYDSEKLERIRGLADLLEKEDYQNHALDILEIASMMDMFDLTLLLDKLRTMDKTVTPIKQMHEAFCMALDNITGAKE